MPSCLVCHRAEPPEPLYQGLVRCPECGFVWADLSVPEEEIKALYNRNYFFDGEYSDYLAERAALERSFRHQLKTFRRHAPGGSVFDIGCAYGFFLNVAREFYEPAAGIDLCSEAVEFCTNELGLNVTRGEFLEQDLQPGQYDHYTCWMTIEHLAQPAEYVERVAELLQPGGCFAVVTGDIEALNARLAGPRWRVIHPPTHLWYFSKRSLAQLLRRCGLELVHCSYVGTHRSVDMVLHKLLAHRHRALYEKLEHGPWKNWIFYFNSFDNLYVIARKPG